MPENKNDDSKQVLDFDALEAEFPPGTLEGILNQPYIREARMGETERRLPYVHVSDLLKNGSDDRFCVREHVLRHFENFDRPAGSVPAKMKLLWDTGNLIGDHIVIKNGLLRHPRYRDLVWGDWTCDRCNYTHKWSHYPGECNICQTGNRKWTYKEVDLRSESIRLVGHPDLLIRMSNGTIIIYEIKTIDRADIVFGEMTEPLGDHLMQASYYYYLLKHLGYSPSPFLRFLYIDRSVANIYREVPFKEIVADVAPVKRVQPGLDQCKQLVEHIEKRTLPPRICQSYDDSRTKKCTRVASCFGRRLTKIPTPT